MEEILSKEDIWNIPDKFMAGTIRHTIEHPDGTVEGVAVNNLLSVISTFSCDFSGNKFGGYLVIPSEFLSALKRDMREQHARDPEFLKKNKFGGLLGIFSYFTVYEDKETDMVLLKTDVGKTVFVFTVGDEHNVVHKQEALDKLGYEGMGFDNRIVFNPFWLSEGAAYAPLPLLQEWVSEDNYSPARNLLENPPQDALTQWWNQGQISAPTKEAMPKLLTSGREND